jgi:hypothetical protein
MFFISESGEYEVKPQYYYYKQLCRVGQRGMKVASVESDEDSEIVLMAFASNGTRHPDAFILMNLGDSEKEIAIEVVGSKSSFAVTRSSDTEQYKALGDMSAPRGTVVYTSPAGSVSTFVAK